MVERIHTLTYSLHADVNKFLQEYKGMNQENESIEQKQYCKHLWHQD